MGESGAKGCEVVVSGKLRGQRAKSMKFVDGLMIHSGDPVNDYVDSACRHVLLRQDRAQEASARQCVHCGAQGGDPATKPLLRDQGCQACPGAWTCCLSSQPSLYNDQPFL